ncbi:MAG: glycine cleavage system protein H [Burkholderiales bacterium]
MLIRGCDFPEDRHYHPDFNVWLKEEASGVVLLGATSFGVALAVEFVAFLPKALGAEIDAGRAVGLLEISKVMVSVRTPVKGRILGHNEAAVADPSLISNDPYGAGWLLRLEVGAWDRQGLVTGDAIRAAFEDAMDLDNFTGMES